ncbi:hypothetical protein F4810DRAFT_722741 [Camillea tinctor]|nr:hypothetical protein F4810DRAFT_722741 [Camillea tinctor]
MVSSTDSSFRLDLYAILNVPQDASFAAIRVAHRKLSHKYHPDKQSTSPVANHENFILLQRAYEILYNPSKKQEYDRQYQPLVETETHQSTSNDESLGQRNPFEKEEVHEPVSQEPAPTPTQPPLPLWVARDKESLVAPLERLWGLYELLRSLMLPRPSCLAEEPEYRCLAKLEEEIKRRRDNWFSLRDAIAAYKHETGATRLNRIELLRPFWRLRSRIESLARQVEALGRAYEDSIKKGVAFCERKRARRRFDSLVEEYLDQMMCRCHSAANTKIEVL